MRYCKLLRASWALCLRWPKSPYLSARITIKTIRQWTDKSERNCDELYRLQKKTRLIWFADQETEQQTESARQINHFGGWRLSRFPCHIGLLQLSKHSQRTDRWPQRQSPQRFSSSGRGDRKSSRAADQLVAITWQ